MFLQDGLTHLWGIKFDFAPTQNWSIWLDGIAFYKTRPDAASSDGGGRAAARLSGGVSPAPAQAQRREALTTTWTR